MSSTISDPFFLANYSIAKKLLHARNSTTGSTLEASANVHVTYTDSKLDGFATVAAQGDGVHVLDISSLHPAVSHTLGPSVAFACPAVSCMREIDGAKICSTYAVLDAAPEIKPEETGRTVWRWKTTLDGGMASGSGDKLSVVVPGIISRIFVHQSLSSQVVLMSPQASLSVTDLDLNVQTSFQASNDDDRLYKVFEYSRAQCPFILPFDENASGLVLVVFIKRNTSMFARVLSVKDDCQITDLGVTEVSSAQDIADVSCSNTGHISVLASNGLWRSFQLQVNSPHVSIYDICEPVALASFTFLATRSSMAFQEVSLLALNSSLVLLAAVPTSPPSDVVLLLWDLQYSVVLASNTFTIPSTLSRSSSQGISILLVNSTPSQAIILLSPKLPLVDPKPQHRSSVLVVPLQAPSASTIANAMGRMSEGTKWLSKNVSAPANVASSLILDSSRRALIGKMRAAINQNQPQGADELFFQWVKQEEKRRTTAPATEATAGDSVILGHEFVKQVVNTVLQPAKSADVMYSSKIIRYLFEQQVVSAAMVDEGLLPLLRLRSDWQSIKAALKSVRDLPESDIMSLLQSIVSVHRQHAVASSSDMMQIDASVIPEETLSLTEYLSLCLSYSCSQPPLRLAIRKNLSQAEDIVCILEVLESWIAIWVANDANLVDPSSPETKSTQGAENGLPALDKILSFLQTILDSSFLVLLQYPPSHQLLRKIFSHLESEVTFIDEIRQLCGPLEPFVKAQKKAIAEAANEVKKDQVAQGDWRKRRKQAFAQANLHVGLYQVEELSL